MKKYFLILFFLLNLNSSFSSERFWVTSSEGVSGYWGDFLITKGTIHADGEDRYCLECTIGVYSADKILDGMKDEYGGTYFLQGNYEISIEPYEFDGEPVFKNKFKVTGFSNELVHLFHLIEKKGTKLFFENYEYELPRDMEDNNEIDDYVSELKSEIHSTVNEPTQANYNNKVALKDNQQEKLQLLQELYRIK